MNTQETREVWILGEQREGRVLPVTHELLTRGRALADSRGATLCAVLCTGPIDEAGLRDLVERGADRVVAIEAIELMHFDCERYAACLMALINERDPEIFIAAATTTGRTLMPYLAIRANTGLTADCTGLEIDAQTGLLLQTRPAIGGNVMATIKTPSHRPQMATVRPRSTAPALRVSGRPGVIERRSPAADGLKSRVRRTGFIPREESHDIAEADRIVCIGRGVRKADGVGRVRILAEHLGAAVGGTRDVVDRGWLSYPHQIGLSGKTVSPSLYIGLGVSGAIQHVAGMQTAGTIVAVNTDPEAWIFRFADFGIVGDLFDAVPAIVEALPAGSAEENK
ncbi:MAG TPA: electron transfer flavoprotein subunit alpha/FixB family protein [Candidatus Ozemobacteraceae bacterium]|nr:electron transfer flavoprotein subunit alpha/FixB family protein [Candidatus Ozemobacteraceae bacterium]